MNDLIFGGAITTQQLIIIIASVVGIILAITLAKKVAKIIISVVIAIVGLAYFGIISPDQVTDITSFVADKGIAVVQEVASHSDNIRVDTTNGVTIKISNDGETWYDISNVDKVIVSDNYAVILTDDKESVKFDDEYVVKLLDLIKQ